MDNKKLTKNYFNTGFSKGIMLKSRSNEAETAKKGVLKQAPSCLSVFPE
jgi:hypothetical protein